MNPAEFANIRNSEEHFWWYRGMRSILFRMMDPHLTGRRVDRALEAGCGTGYLSHLLQRERNWPIIPMDLSRHGLRYARELGVQRPVQGDIRALPFAEGTFDVVMSVDVIAHLPLGEEIFAAGELARVTRKGGLLVVRTAALDILRSRHSEFAHERQRFTQARLVQLFAGVGIRILGCTYVNSLLLPAALFKFRLWEPLLRKEPESGVHPVEPWLDRLLFAPLAMEAAWVGGGRRFPVGQSLMLIGERIL